MFVITDILRICHSQQLLVDSRGLCRLRGFCFRNPPNSILHNHLSSQLFNTILCTEKVSWELSLKELKYFITTPSFLFMSLRSTIGYPPFNSMPIFPKGNNICIIIISVQDTNVMYREGSCPAQHTPQQDSLVQDHFWAWKKSFLFSFFV